MEVERQLLEKKVAIHQEETAKMTEKLSQTKMKKTMKKTEVVEIKQQVTAMEELTMSLSTQTQEKDAQIEKLRAELVEKDTEHA